MDRTPILNSHSSEPGRVGYDAYFSQHPGPPVTTSVTTVPEPKLTATPLSADQPDLPTTSAASAPAHETTVMAESDMRNVGGTSASVPVPERAGRSSDLVPLPENLPAALSSPELLVGVTAYRPARLRSTRGVRGALNKVGFRFGLSPAEQRTEERRNRIRHQLTATFQVAVISVKGGAGRTTATAVLGSTFANLRADRVVAIDANPDFGDLASRTGRHPYGLTLRDLARASGVEAFSAVQAFTSTNTADLATVASPWTTESNEAMSGAEFDNAAAILRRHYNLLFVDCGTGVLHPATQAVLAASNAVVVVTPASVRGVAGAASTLSWLGSHGLERLVGRSTIIVVHQHPAKPIVDVDAVEHLFASIRRPTTVVPFDQHLAEGGLIDMRLLDPATRLAFEELAASIADGFPSYVVGGARGADDAGAWA
ncbi:MinD/ParA family protein [Nocardia sp. NPDC050793]|uniref:MinD/ParA family ATP-binding protein n=1 Tax=Nocardia sp. NPDC050793 TaxID=3155159 RepID=UPI003410E5D3